jgi:hypothetical protein
MKSRAPEPPAGSATALLHYGGLAAALAGFLLTQYRRALDMPFSGDDFLILDRVRHASFAELFSREGARIFGWYRPISRELHYWLLTRAFGLHELPFHVASFALWVAVLLAAYRHLSGLLGPRASAIAVTGAACLSAWGYPLLAVAGVQELWMLLFGFLYLESARRARPLATFWLALALLSKESAVMLVAISAATSWIADRLDLRVVVRRHAAALAVCAAWFVFHPTLATQLSGGVPASAETSSRLPLWAMATGSVLAVLNLEAWPIPAVGWSQAVTLGLIGAAPLVAFVVAWRSPAALVTRRTILACAGWALLGFAAPALPALGWHSYYTLLGLIGAWAALGALLAPRVSIAVAVVTLAAVLRAGRATTPSVDWGDESFQLQSGYALRALRDSLTALHPSLPHGSRVYFTHQGNPQGLVSGGSLALRIWYDDPTLRSYHLRDFVVRGPEEPPGPDYFFYVDATHRLVELAASRDGRPPAQRDPAWEGRHYNLATALLLGGDVEGAGGEYLAVARADPARSDCALYAAACYRALGREALAEQAVGLAMAAGVSRADAEAKVTQLVATLPRRDVRPPPR